MLGIDLEVAQHHLNILLGTRSVKQRASRFALECQQVIYDEVKKLSEEGFISKVHYPRWFSNVILIKKANESCRMHVDYTNLN